MSTGAFYPLPMRHIADNTFGVSAEHHARFCADLVAVSNTLPFATMQIDGSAGAIYTYSAMHPGASQPTVLRFTAGTYQVIWAYGYENSFEQFEGFRPRMARATLNGSGNGQITYVLTGTTARVDVYTFNSSGTGADRDFTLSVW